MQSENPNSNLVTIIIPNINGIKHLESCYPSILKQSHDNYKIILVDNNSTDGSVEYTLAEFPMIEIVKFGHNTGFAKAVNAGIEIALNKYNSPFILLLNNDIELTNNFLEEALNTFQNEPGADMIAVKMMNFFDRSIIDDTGNFITKKGGTSYPRGNAERDTGQYDTPGYIFGACAGAAFYRKTVFEKIGLFDEEFFAYLEDIDLSFRAQLSGLKCYYQPKSICFHKRGGSSISTFMFQARLNERNIVWLRFKNYPLGLYILYQPLFLLARLRRFYYIMKYYGIKCLLSVVSGYIEGVLRSIFFLGKRYKIQKMRIVSSKYILSLFR